MTTEGDVRPPMTGTDHRVATSPTSDQSPRRRRPLRRWLIRLGVLIAVITVVVVLWNQGEQLLDGEASSLEAYLTVALLVFGDALFPVLPGETTINAACILAVDGKLDLALVMVSGALGAIVGDSTLYWLARCSRGPVRRWLDNAVDGMAGRTAVDMLDKHGSVFLLFGRYVPGLRFAINVTLGGIVRMPYPRFLFWSGLSGILWSVWVCISAFYISSALDGYPLAALVISTFAGTVLIGSGVWAQTKVRSHHVAAATESEAASTG